MTDKTSINRADLLKIANLVKPAMASQPYIKALTHIYFDGKTATAFNDTSAIQVNAPLAVRRLVPGDLLIRALGSFTADQIAFTQGDGDSLTLKSGRATVKLPTLAPDKFPFEWPEGGSPSEVVIDGSILRGIERCLLSVGKDATHPAHMGITLDFDADGDAVLYSTDNSTISRYQTKTRIELPGDAPIIMPRFFCEQLVSLSRAFPDAERVLVMRDDGSIDVEFGNEAALFTRTPVNAQPVDFGKMVDKYCKLDGLKSRLQPIPDNLDAAMGRALLVLSGELRFSTELTYADGAVVMKSTSDLGEAVDELKWAGKPDIGKSIDINPEKVLRGAKVCALIGLTPHVTVLADADANFVHIVANIVKA